MKPPEKPEKPRFKDRPLELRPRERLIQGSPQDLSNSELLAILLQTGTVLHDVTDLAAIVLTHTGGLEGLLHQSMRSLCEVKGIGPSKACMLLAAIELGRRLALVQSQQEKRRITTSASAAWFIRTQIRNSEQESFHALYLDAKHSLIAAKELFVGTANSANVHPRDIFREAVRLNAVALIIGHNHPSGDLTPSTSDLKLTKRLCQAAELLGITLLDHIIVADPRSEAYLSFKENGYLSPL